MTPAIALNEAFSAKITIGIAIIIECSVSR